MRYCLAVFFCVPFLTLDVLPRSLMMRTKSLLASTLIATAMTTPALAAPVALVNPNFDTPGDSGFVTTGSTGVTGYVGELFLFPEFAFFGSNFNDAFVITDINGIASGSNLLVRNARLTTESTARVAAVAGDAVTFTFDGVLENSGSGILAGIDFFDGSGVLLGTSQETFTLGNAAGIANQQLGLTLSGAAPVGTETLGLRIEATDGVQTFRVDNFRLDIVPIPEPSSLILAAVGGAALLGRRRVSSR